MAHKIKEIGAVVRLSTGGFVVTVQRYGCGRLLPAPRTLLDTTGAAPAPFATALDALDALAVWKATPRAVKQVRAGDIVRQSDAIPAPRVRHAAHIVPNEVLTYEDEHKPAPRKAHKARRVVHPVIKLMPETPAQIIRDRRTKDSLLVAMLIATGQAKVTRCPDTHYDRANSLQKRRGGGMMPAHLNPLTMGEHVS